MELGESFEETARREVFEETGLVVGELLLLGLDSGRFYEYPNGHQVYNAIAVFTSSEFTGAVKADDMESVDVGFFHLHELPENISPPDKNILMMYLNRSSVALLPFTEKTIGDGPQVQRDFFTSQRSRYYPVTAIPVNTSGPLRVTTVSSSVALNANRE